jgi:MarR family transcriptional regulator, transcriptional regulator for hemolysin
MKPDNTMSVESKDLTRLCFLFTDIARLYTHYFEQCMRPLQLSLLECHILVCVSRNEGASQSLLSTLTETDRSTIGRIIDRMEKHGLIERHEHSDDRRTHCLQLGPIAPAVLIEFTRIDDGVRRAVLAGVSAAEQSQCMRLLEQVHANLIPLVPPTRNGIKTGAMADVGAGDAPRAGHQSSLNIQ